MAQLLRSSDFVTIFIGFTYFNQVMNFSLQYIEKNVDEEELLKAELLLEKGRVGPLTELDKHLWIANIEGDDRHLEVEAKISPSKVLAGSCECETFRQKRQCSHFIALLLKLRRQTAKPTPRPSKSDSQKKLTTGLVLNQIDPEELIDFVRQYAKTNRNFSIALKARFAASVDTMKSDEKYRQLLESAISAARKTDRSISQRGAQKISKVLKELEVTAQRALADKDFVEGFMIAKSIIERISPVFSKVTSDKVRLEPQLEKAFRLISSVLSASIAPALEKQIWEYCAEESNKLLYRSNGLDLAFLNLMHQVANTTARKQLLLEQTAVLLSKYEREKRPNTDLLLFRFKLLEAFGHPEMAQQLIAQHLNTPEILLFAVKYAIEHDQPKQAQKLAEAGLDLPQELYIKDQLEDHLLQLASQENQSEKVLEYGERRLLRSLNTEYYDQMRATNPANWPDHVERLLQKIRKLPFSKEKLHLAAYILLTEGRIDALEAHLNQSLSVDLLLEFGPKIQQVGHQRLYELYHHLLHYYLRNHVGRKPSLKIRHSISQLQALGLTRLADQLVEEFRSEYGERHSLMEELDFF